MRAIGAPSSSIGNDASRTAETIAFDLIGEAKHVLIVGDSAASLPAMLEASGRELTFVLSSAVHSDEARVYSSHVEVADLGAVTLSAILPGRTFDAIVVDAGGAPLPNVIRLLDDARSLLVNRGPLVALLPSATHGAVRLALLKGVIADTLDNVAAQEIDRFTLERVFRTFLEANYDVEAIERASHAIFEPSNLLPPIERARFSEEMVREIGTDPDAFTLQFIVKARPFAGINGQRSATLAQILAAAEASRRAAEQRAYAAESQLVKDQPQPAVALAEPPSPVHTAALEAELEGTRHQAALNAAAAARAQLEIERIEAHAAELEATVERQTAEIAEHEARRADMVARIHELEEALAATGVAAAAELADRTRDMVARIGQLEGLLSSAQADTAKANTKADAARAGLQRRLTYVAQLTSLNTATAEKLRQTEAAVRALESELARANKAARGSAGEVEQLRTDLKQKNERLQAMGAALSRRSRIVAKLETVRIALQDQLERVSGALAERSARISVLEANETTAALELWLVRAAFKSRATELEKRARTILAEGRFQSANLEEALRHAEGQLAVAAAEKAEIQRVAERSLEDLDELRSEIRILEESRANAVAQHERDLAEMRGLLDGLRSELASAKAVNAEIPILRIRAIASEKRLEMHEARLLEMKTRARGLEDDLLAAVSRELQLQRDIADVGEHARRVESDLQNAARRAERAEDEIERSTQRAALQEIHLAEAVRRAEILEPQLDELTDQTKRLETDAVAAADREDELRYQLSQRDDHATRLKAELQHLSQRASQLEDDLRRATALSQEQSESLSAADHRSREQAIELRQAAEQSAQQIERLTEQSTRCEQLQTELDEICCESRRVSDQLAEIYASKTWKFASGLARIVTRFRRSKPS